MKTCCKNSKKSKYWEIETIKNEQIIRTSKLDPWWGLNGYYKCKYKKFDNPEKANADSEKKIAAQLQNGFEIIEPKEKGLPNMWFVEILGSNDVFLVRRMLEAGVKLTENETSKFATLDSFDVLSDFIERGIKLHPSTLAGAALGGNNNIIKLLLDHEFDVDSPKNGDTPLMFAAQKGKIESAELLLNAGANVNAASSTGSTSIMHAAIGGKPEMVKLLLNCKADPNAKNQKGKTALDYAVEEGIEEQDPARKNYQNICKDLIAAGASINDKLRVELIAFGVLPEDENTTFDESFRQQAVGIWQNTCVRYFDSSDDDPDWEGPEEFEENKGSIELKDDGTFQLYYYESQITGTWKIHKRQITTESKGWDPYKLELTEEGSLLLYDYDEEHGARFANVYMRSK